MRLDRCDGLRVRYPTGDEWECLVPIIVSPIGMAFIRLLMEPGGLRGLFRPSTQSWAFLFGDVTALPFAFVMLALGWRNLAEGWYDRDWWFWLALLLGVAIAFAWHFLLDGPGYKAQGYGELLGSPTKLWHDFVVYGSLAGALVYLGIPVLAHDFWPYGALALVGLGVWGVLGVADNTVHKLDLANLHPPVSETKLAT